MAIGPVVTGGFGSFGSIPLVVTAGFAIGDSAEDWVTVNKNAAAESWAGVSAGTDPASWSAVDKAAASEAWTTVSTS